jgi:hypothetical protein
MLWMARLLTMTSTLLSPNGSAVMSAVCSSMRSATFSSLALARVADGELSVWSACQRSTPMARPRGNRLAAASNTAPRPAAHVEYGFVAVQFQVIEDAVPHFELAGFGRVDIQGCAGGDPERGCAGQRGGQSLAAGQADCAPHRQARGLDGDAYRLSARGDRTE